MADPVNTGATRSTSGVDPRLVTILQHAAASLPPGYTMRIAPGGGVYGRGGRASLHMGGKALDVEIYDPSGNKLSNYQSPSTFNIYQSLANSARFYQQQAYPDLVNQFHWGGYFSGKISGQNKTYGAMDLMHFSLGHEVGRAGDWQHGLNPQWAKKWGVPPQQAIQQYNSLRDTGQTHQQTISVINAPSVTPTPIPFSPPSGNVSGYRDVPIYDPATGQYSWPGESIVPHQDIPLLAPPSLPNNIPPSVPSMDIPLSAPPSMPNNIPSYVPQTYNSEQGIPIGNGFPTSDYLSPSGPSYTNFSTPMNYGSNFISPSGQFDYTGDNTVPITGSIDQFSGMIDPASQNYDLSSYHLPQSQFDLLNSFLPSAVGGNDIQSSDFPAYDPIAQSIGGSDISNFANIDIGGGALPPSPDITSSPGEITDNPFYDPSWTAPMNQSSPGTVTDNPFADSSWLPPSEAAALAAGGGTVGGAGAAGGTVGGRGAWQNIGYGRGSPFGAGAAGPGGAGFGGYGGLGGSGAPVTGYINTGVNDTSVFQRGGVDPTGDSGPPPGQGLEGIHSSMIGVSENALAGGGEANDAADAALMAAKAAAPHQYPLTWGQWRNPFPSGGFQQRGNPNALDPVYHISGGWYPTSYTTDPSLQTTMPGAPPPVPRVAIDPSLFNPALLGHG